MSLLYMFRASMRPSSGENYCTYATLALVTLYGWRLVCCSRYSNFLLMMGAWMPETCREETKINILNRIVHLVGFICKIIQGCTVNKT